MELANNRSFWSDRGPGAGLNFRLADLPVFPVRFCLFEPVPIPVIEISDQFHLCFEKYLAEKVLR